MRPSKLAHIVLRTRDVERLAEWYCKAFDARRTIDNTPAMVFITFDDEHHRLGFIALGEAAVEPGGLSPGLAHMAFTFPTARDLLKQYDQLKRHGIKPAFTIHHGATLSAYFHDPDGNGVEMFADVFDTADAAQAFLESPQIVKNPIGKRVDFDALSALARRGASEAELLAYPDEDVDPWALAKELADALDRPPTTTSTLT